MKSIYLKSVSGDMSKGSLSNRHTKIKIDSYDLDIVKEFLLNQTERDFFYIKNDYNSKKAKKAYNKFLNIAEELLDRGIFLDKYYARTSWELVTPQ